MMLSIVTLMLLLNLNWIVVKVEGLNSWNIFKSKISPSRPISDILQSEIISLLPQTNRGLQEQRKAEIIDSIKRISMLPCAERSKANIDGKWKLLWTTEKVSLFFDIPVSSQLNWRLKLYHV